MDSVLWVTAIVLALLALVFMGMWIHYTFSAPVTVPNISDEHVTLPAPPKPQPVSPAPSLMTVLENPQLKMLTGTRVGKEFNLKSGEVYIGRLENANENILIALDEPSVSRRHAKLSINSQMDEITIQDCKSTHGTQLFRHGAEPLELESEQDYVLRNGDIVQFGNVVKLEVVIPADPPASGLPGQMTLM